MSTFAMVNWRQVTRTALNPEQQTRSYIPTVKHSGVRDVVKRNYHIVTVLWSKPWICNRIPIWPQIKLLYRGQFSWKLVIDVHHRLHKSIMVGILRPLNDAAPHFYFPIIIGLHHTLRHFAISRRIRHFVIPGGAVTQCHKSHCCTHHTIDYK